MGARRRYLRRPGPPVVAVQLDLETEGIAYRKWGDVQHGKPGDWLVDNDGEVYTVDRTSFARTYRPVEVDGVPQRGLYEKVAPVWAERMDAPGTVATKEGRTHYEAGWYLVSNEAGGSDAYAISPERFEALYQPAR